MSRLVLFLSILTIYLSGCGQAITDKGSLPPAIPTLMDTPTFQAPLATLTPSATAKPPTPTPTLIPTATFTPSPTPNPMSIPALRAGVYPGSEIVIVNELAAGSNYHRYYAYYLSESYKIYALLTVPDGKMPDGGWPAIVFNHGYIPPKQYRTTERYIAYVDWLARAGYIIIRIDYRGNDKSEGVASGAYGSPGYTVDVLNAVASLKRYPQANPQKIGMWGHSMGGFLTLRAMVISPDIKVGVIWAGVVGSYPDMLTKWKRAGPTPTPQPTTPADRGWRSGWVQQYGSPEQNPEFWSSISANSYLADLSGPLQLHHDTSDSEVPAQFSETLAKEIQAAGGTSELYTYPGDDHNLANSFGLAMQRTIAFFDRYLK